MKIVQFNAGLNGSPGMLMRAISEEMVRQDIDNRMLYTYGTLVHANAFQYASNAEVKLNALRSRISGRYGFVSEGPTKRAVAFLEDYQPDLIHVHNIHGHDVAFDQFFAYIAEKGIPVVYTFHDCWAFTGYCTHYVRVGCDRYQTECHDCPLYRPYSWFRDRSTENFRDKKKALLGLPSLTVVTPSRWMAEQVETSFLKDVPVAVIPNGIDTEVFRPVQSAVRERHGIGDRKMILALANAISAEKGLNDLLELNERLSGDEVLVLIGINDRMKRDLPDNIVALPRTASQNELALYYSAADVLVNPTHEDNFPTVNLEALACGTPVITYDVGGSPESLNEVTGRVVPEGDTAALYNAVRDMIKTPDVSSACRTSVLDNYEKRAFAGKNIGLYRQILKNRG